MAGLITNPSKSLVKNKLKPFPSTNFCSSGKVWMISESSSADCGSQNIFADAFVRKELNGCSCTLYFVAITEQGVISKCKCREKVSMSHIMCREYKLMSGINY